jgi:hypothetical protein
MKQDEYTFLNKEFWCWHAIPTLINMGCRIIRLDIENYDLLPANQRISAHNVDILFNIMMDLGIQS